MIASEAENLIDLINHKAQLQQNVLHHNGFKTRLEELNKSLAELEQRTSLIKPFTDRKFNQPNIANKSVAVASQINSILEHFREDPGSIISYNTIVLKNALKGVINDLDLYISLSWRDYTSRTFQTNQQDLNVFSAIPMFAGIVQKIRILLIQIDNCRSTIPMGESDFEKFDRLIIEFDAAWKELGSTDLPPEVQCFLQAAGTREGAAINLLTTEVKDWLRTKGISESFRIHMGSS